MSLRIVHVLDHSIPLHSGYAFRTRAILREQRRLGWETFQLTSPKHVAPCAPEEDVDGLHFYRTAGIGGIFGHIAGIRELALMHATRRRLDEVVRSVRPDVLHAHSPVLNDALARIRSVNPRVRVLLVGGGPQESALKERAVASGLSESIVFAGRVPHQDIERYYDLIDVLVYPRLSMRLTDLVTPLKPLEAMAQARLLVASDVGGHRELIRPGETGTLFKSGDAEGLAAAVLDLLRHPERCARLN